MVTASKWETNWPHNPRRALGHGQPGQPMRDNGSVNREERIAKARQMAAAKAPPPAAVAQKRAARIHQRLSDIGAAQAQRHVAAASQAVNVTYLEPTKTPGAWEQAVELARLVTIRRGKRRDTITYGEVQWVILDELELLVDPSMFVDLVKSLDSTDDGVLLSSIIVNQTDGKPRDEFLPYAEEKGFDSPLETLQRQVYDHFA